MADTTQTPIAQKATSSTPPTPPQQPQIQNKEEGESAGKKIAMLLYFILIVIEVLLALRFILGFLGANVYAGFGQLILNLTSPLLAPFRGLFPVTAGERAVFDPSVLVAMVVYALVFAGIAQLLKILTAKKPETAQ